MQSKLVGFAKIPVIGLAVQTSRTPLGFGFFAFTDPVGATSSGKPYRIEENRTLTHVG